MESNDALRQGLAGLVCRPKVEVRDIITLARQAGIEPDPWQRNVLTTTARRIILNCSRQSGKSTIAGTMAMWQASYRDRQTILMGAPSQTQSSELLLKARAVYNVSRPEVVDLNTGIEKHNLHNAVTRMRLANHSRIMVVPGTSDTVRGFSAVDLLLVDEAAYVQDSFYQAVFPMLAVSKGRMILMSTPHAKSGVFYELWTKAPDWDFKKADEDQPNAWLKIRVPWNQCPRIDPRFIEGERSRFGDLYVAKEYMCEFIDVDTAPFTEEEVERMASSVPQWKVF